MVGVTAVAGHVLYVPVSGYGGKGKEKRISQLVVSVGGRQEMLCSVADDGAGMIRFGVAD